jgi:hypothetical protein
MLVDEMISHLGDLDDEDLDALAEAVESEQDDREGDTLSDDELESDDELGEDETE